MIKNTGGRKRRVGFKGDVRTPYARRGWEDARQGRPFDYALVDRIDSYCAGSYELMRLRVMALIDAGFNVPRWNTNATMPPAVHGAMDRAMEINAASRRDGICYWPVGATGWQPAVEHG